jgi:hypothetical protein
MNIRYALPLALAAGMLFSAPGIGAQDSAGKGAPAKDTSETKDASETKTPERPPVTVPFRRPELEPGTTRIFYLPNISQQTEMQDIMNALRSVAEFTRISMLPSAHAIALRGTPEQIAFAEKLLAEIDKTKVRYRVDFRISELDGDRKAGSRDYSLLMERNNRGSLKSGARVPVGTAKGTETDPKPTHYLDIGSDFDCVIDSETDRTVELRFTADISEVEMKGTDLPRQSKFESRATVELGVPTLIGRSDNPVSKRTIEVEATVTRVAEKQK